MRRTYFGNILLSLAKKGANIDRSLRKEFLDKEIDKFNTEYIISKDSGITLRNNEIKDITKVIETFKNLFIY